MKRIAIVFWEDYLSIAPTIISLSKSFSKQNFIVDIYTTSLNKRYPKIIFEDYNINIITLNDSIRSTNFIENRINILLKNNKNSSKFPLKIYNLLKRVFKYFLEMMFFIEKIKFTNLLKSNFDKNEYCLYFVTDSTGIASLPKNILNNNISSVFYLSLELDEISLINPFTNPYKYYCYKKVKKAFSIIKNIIIQDESRANILIEEFNLNKNNFNFHLLPNSVSQANSFERSNYLKNKFNINNHIILHIGQISEAALSYEIALSLNNQTRYSLVFHDKKNTDINDPYIQLIAKSTNFPVHFSLSPVELKELDEIILSAKIGILGYSSNFGKNFEMITMASGKLIMLLRLGIPVIIMEFPGIRELIDKYKCGIVVKHWDEVIPAADLIMDNLELYSNNALTCFINEFDFNKHFQIFFKKLQF